MMKLHSKRRGQQGFTLIEAMVAFAVLAFGLLAIASFQAKLVSGSGYSKARAEAVAIAQQKLDEIRSYVNESELVANLEGSTTVTITDAFPVDIADGTYPAVADSIDGTNAQFARQWNVALAGDIADVAVTVSWVDPSQGAQSVVLNTSVTWRNPRGMADMTALDEPLVPSATGRAYLGDGYIDPADIPAGDDNGDGTSDGDFDSDGDLELVDNASGDVVLTLRDACNVETGVCTDFVRVKGYITIDNAASGMSLSSIYVLASDAAFCARDLVTNTGITTPNGSYDYYFYTCYLGGGWHGNIGLLMSGANSNDAVCLGDPYADLTSGDEKWKRYELAKRRVYRGMLHKIDGSGNEITDGNGDTLFYSQGIADATLLPDPAWPAREFYHSFVVTRITGAGTGGGTASDCLAALTRADNDPDNDPATANFFDGSANDFVCLNADSVPNDYATGVDRNTYSPYLDTFDETVYSARNDCPYDPSDPPSWRFTIDGTITTPGTPATMEVMTSDGEDNCRVTITGTTSTYECDVYAWENANGTINGWDGAITVTPPVDQLCAPTPVNVTTVYTNPTSISYADITSDQANENYTCMALASPAISGTITSLGGDLSGSLIEVSDASTICTVNVYTTVLGNDSLDYACEVVEPEIGVGWSGSVNFTPSAAASGACTAQSWTFADLRTNSPNNDYNCNPTLQHWVWNDVFGDGVVDMSGTTVSATAGATCTATVISSNLVYADCQVTEYGSGWTGSITITPPLGMVCSPSPITYAGLTTDTLNTVNCAVPAVGGMLAVSGNITVGAGVDVNTISASTADGACTVQPTGSYDCQVFDDGSGWSGSVSISSSGTDVVCAPASHVIPTITADYPVPDVTDCSLDLSGVVTVSGSIWIYDTARAVVTAVTMTNGSCTFAATGGAYTCTTNTIASGSTWTGSVQFSSDKTVCGTNPISFSAVDPRSTLTGNDVVIQKNAVSCP